MNEAQVTMVGYIASAPRLFVTKAGRFVANMRVGMTPRKLDKETGQWSDGDTSFVTVTCWRALAANVASCLRKGDPVVVKGRMRVRQYDDKDGNQRVDVEVDASTMGHDLNRGVAHFLRTKRSPGEAPPLQVPARPEGGVPGLAGNGFEPGQQAGAWDGRDIAAAAQSQPEPEFPAEEDEFAAADLFDDAGIEAASLEAARDPVAGGEDGGPAAGDGTQPASGTDPGDAPQLGQAA
jgi:single-strand DNA-binding protein